MNNVIMPMAKIRFGATDVCSDTQLLTSRKAGDRNARTTAIIRATTRVSASCSSRAERRKVVLRIASMVLTLAPVEQRIGRYRQD